MLGQIEVDSMAGIVLAMDEREVFQVLEAVLNGMDSERLKGVDTWYQDYKKRRDNE